MVIRYQVKKEKLQSMINASCFRNFAGECSGCGKKGVGNRRIWRYRQEPAHEEPLDTLSMRNVEQGKDLSRR